MSDQTTPTTTFKDQVNEVVSKFTVDDKGNTVLPDDVSASEEVVYAATLEKRHRDTQSAYTKERQNAVRLQAQNEEIKSQLLETATANITSEQRVELDTLKVTDPDAWLAKTNEYKEAATTAATTKLQEAELAGDTAAVVASREQLVAEYATRYGVEMTDEVIASQLPASYMQELEKGEVDFDAFLTKAHEFIAKDKVVEGAGATTKAGTDFAQIKGTTDASTAAQQAAEDTGYENDTY